MPFMTHVEALDILEPREPHTWRYRQLTADDNPDTAQRDGYRALVIRLAGGIPEPPPEMTCTPRG